MSTKYFLITCKVAISLTGIKTNGLHTYTNNKKQAYICDRKSNVFTHPTKLNQQYIRLLINICKPNKKLDIATGKKNEKS